MRSKYWTVCIRISQPARLSIVEWGTYRDREVGDSSPELTALPKASHPNIRKEFGEAPQTGGTDRMKAFLQLVLLTICATRHDLVPPRLQRREGGVGREGQEGILVQVTLDQRTKRTESGREEIRKRRDERSIRRTDRCRSRQRRKLQE